MVDGNKIIIIFTLFIVYVLIINVVSCPPGALIWKIKYLVSCSSCIQYLHKLHFFPFNNMVIWIKIILEWHIHFHLHWPRIEGDGTRSLKSRTEKNGNKNWDLRNRSFLSNFHEDRSKGPCPLPKHIIEKHTVNSYSIEWIHVHVLRIPFFWFVSNLLQF